MVCYDSAQALLQRLRALHASSHRPRLIWTNLFSEKWRIRDQTAEINSVFASCLFWLYTQFFLSTICYRAETIKDDVEFLDSSLAVLCILLLMFMLARKASEIRSICVETQEYLMKRLKDTTAMSHIDSASMQHFQFSEGCDSLRCGCFALSIAKI